MNYEDYQITKGYPKEDFEGLEAEYAKYFIDFYNKETFNALASITVYRDESIRRIKDLKEEIDNLISEVKTSLKRYRDEEDSGYGYDIFLDLETYLENSKQIPNRQLRYLLQGLLSNREDEKRGAGYGSVERNIRIIENVEGYLDEIYEKSCTLKRVTIIKSTAQLFIDKIIDSGAPIRFEGSSSHAFIRSLLPNIEVNKPSKDTIYEWYAVCKTETENKDEAFDELKTEIVAQGLNVEDYITTDDPENFDRAYRNYLNDKKSTGGN